jgi:hypothetical protein
MEIKTYYYIYTQLRKNSSTDRPCSGFHFYAQNIRLEGTVQDKAKLSLEMANVMAVNQTTKAMDAYAITTIKASFP